MFLFLRGMGIGTHLTCAAENELSEYQFGKVEVGVEKDNPDARRLYERLGYSVRGEVREEYGYTTPDGVEAWHAVDQWILRIQLQTPAVHADG